MLMILVFFIIALVVEFSIGDRLKNKKLLSLGIHSFMFGVALFFIAFFTDAPIVSLRYGVKPEITPADAGVFVSLFMIMVGLVFTTIGYIFFNKEK